MGLRAVEKVRFARGTARTSPGCAVEHRVIDWASRSSSRGVRTAIMIDVVTEEMHGSDRVPDLKNDCERALVGSAHLQLERNGALRSARASAPQKCLTLPTLLERRFFANSDFGDDANSIAFIDGIVCGACRYVHTLIFHVEEIASIHAVASATTCVRPASNAGMSDVCECDGNEVGPRASKTF